MPRHEEKRRFRSARETAEKQQTGYESTSVRLPEGATAFRLKSAGIKKIDIIPYKVGAGNPNADEGEYHWERTYFTHRSVGASGDTYVCLQKTAGKPCPVCEWKAKQSRNPDADEDALKEMEPKKRQLFNVIDLSEPEKGIQVWDFSFHMFGRLLAKRITDAEEGDGWDMFHHPSEGLTLKLGVEEKSYGGNTYYEVVSIDFQPRKKQHDDSVVDDAHCLDDLLILPKYEKLKAILNQAPADDEDEEAQPVKKKPASKPAPADDEDEEAPAKKKPAKPAPAEEEDEEEEEEEAPPAKKKPAPAEDDEEEEAPPAKKKPAKADSWDDEEEEAPAKKPAKAAPADDEDEEEEEAPPAKKKPAKPAPADEEEEEEAPPSKSPAKKPAKPAPADEDEEW